MAVVWKFRRNAVDVDLSAGFNAGWNTSVWNPSVAAVTGNRLPPLVTETMRLLADDTSHDNLAEEFQTFDNYRWLARSYIQDRTEQYPVWLHAKMNNETGERRALVYDVGLRWLSPQTDTCDLVERSAASVQATVTRGPFWEDPTANAKTAGAGVSILAGAWDYSGVDVVGNAPARISRMTFIAAYNTLYYTKFWIGLRGANKHGTLANFVPIWELEDGTMGTDTALHADATASPGGVGNTCVQCTFGTATWATRITMAFNNATANYSDNFGRFAVLLRAKVDAGTTAEVQLGQGYDAGAIFTGPIIEVTSTAWAIHEVGYLTLPIRNLHTFSLADYAHGYEAATEISIQARRTGGAGNLEMDCLLMIPADELFCYVECGINANDTPQHTLGQNPEGLWDVYQIDTLGAGFYDLGEISTYGLGAPIGDGRMYMVAADPAYANVLTDTYDSTLSLIPRWYNLRGTE